MTLRFVSFLYDSIFFYLICNQYMGAQAQCSACMCYICTCMRVQLLWIFFLAARIQSRVSTTLGNYHFFPFHLSLLFSVLSLFHRYIYIYTDIFSLLPRSTARSYWRPPPNCEIGALVYVVRVYFRGAPCYVFIGARNQDTQRALISMRIRVCNVRAFWIILHIRACACLTAKYQYGGSA